MLVSRQLAWEDRLGVVEAVRCVFRGGVAGTESTSVCIGLGPNMPAIDL